MSWRDRARLSLRVADTDLLELFLGLYTFTWGMGLLRPGSAFLNPNYDLMAALATEEAWGLAFVALGVGKLAAFVSGRWLLRALSAMASYAAWALVFMLIGQATDWQAAGLPHFALASTANAYCAVRLWWAR